MCIPSIEARSTERGYESIVKYCFFIVLVLIDTWWNVNVPTGDADLKRIQVLIDTWWNVNADCKISFRGAKDSFNRYMVECEWVNSHFTGHGNGF